MLTWVKNTMMVLFGGSAATQGLSFGAKSSAKQIVDAYSSGCKGKTALVTGGNSGIGLETAKALAFSGYRVLLCSRSLRAGEDAIDREIRVDGAGGYSVPSGEIVVKELDLASLASISALADDVLATEPRLDLIVLNAGIMALPELERTEAGWEKQIGVNHFGHSLLCERLVRQRLAAARDTPSRVVVLASLAHTMSHAVDVNDLHYSNRNYTPWGAYGQSKLANILYAKALADRLRTAAPHVTVTSLHPGVIKTNLWKSTIVGQSRIVSAISSLFVMNKDIPQGAATTLFACLSPEAGRDDYSGSYLSDCAVALPNDQARDVELRNAFWAATETQLQLALKAQNLPPLPPDIEQACAAL